MAAMAVFSNSSQANTTSFKGASFKALDCIRNKEAGFDHFSSSFLKQLGASAALFTEQSGDQHMANALPVSWMGDAEKAQSDCIIYHQNSSMGHFEIMVRDDEFTPEAARAATGGRMTGVQSSASRVDTSALNLVKVDFSTQPQHKTNQASQDVLDFFELVKKRFKKSPAEFLVELLQPQLKTDQAEQPKDSFPQAIAQETV